MSYFAYILYSEKLKKYYAGSSHDPETRLHYNNLGKKGWTKRGVPRKIFYKKEFVDKKAAMEKERSIKKHKDRKFIEQLISGNIEL